MQVRRVLALLVAILFVSARRPRVAQRNNDDTSKQPQRSSPRSSRTSRRSFRPSRFALLSDLGIHGAASWRAAPGDAADGQAVDAGHRRQAAGELPVKWESNHFVKGQTDTYIPFTLAARSRRRCRPARRSWIRIVNAEQAAAFATMVTAPRSARRKQQTSRRRRADRVRVGQRQLR